MFSPLIVKDRDKKSRVRISVQPQRNNAHLNGTCFNLLMGVIMIFNISGILLVLQNMLHHMLLSAKNPIKRS